MYSIKGYSIDEVFAIGWNTIHACGRKSDSRNGPVISMEDVCATEYPYPQSRVLFLPERRHNPFFALMETIWMFAGSNDLEWLLFYNKRMSEYSDDNKTLTGSAYGYHWVRNYRFDQLFVAATELVQNPETRRVVVSHWNPYKDPLNKQSKDLPCNLQILFRVTDKSILNMTVYNRSNDFVYGQAGSNVVHFSLLLEFMAMVTGYSVGKYTQVSNNLHMYTENPVYKRLYKTYGKNIPVREPYDIYNLGIYPMSTNITYGGENGLLDRYKLFMFDVHYLYEDVAEGLYAEPEHYQSSFFQRIVVPMQRAHRAYKEGNMERALEELEKMPPNNDWKLAGIHWLQGLKKPVV